MRRSINILANTDWFTVIIYLILVTFGWMNIYSVNQFQAVDKWLSTDTRYTMQLIWIIVSLGIAIVIFLIDSRFYSFISYPSYALSLLVLLVVIVVGKEIHGAKSWIIIGPVRLQPSEFAKVATVMAIAKYLSGYNIKPSSLKNIVVTAIIILAPVVLISLQPDFGSTLVFGSLILVLYREGLPPWVLIFLFFMASLFLAWFVFTPLTILIILTIIAFIGFGFINKLPKNILGSIGIFVGFLGIGFLGRKLDLLTMDSYYFFLTVLMASVVTFFIVAVSKKIKGAVIIILFLISFIGYIYSINFLFNTLLQPHQKDRVLVMLGLLSDPYGYEYNVNQSKIAIGSGGFTGRGFLKGPITNLKYVPEQSTDFIFCTIGEEWGFLGSIAFILLFIGLLIRITIIAERQRSRFSRIYGYGVLAVLFFHFAINVGMTLALFPVIGIPLPFLSYGGSSLMSFTILLFILLRLDSTRKAYLV